MTRTRLLTPTLLLLAGVGAGCSAEMVPPAPQQQAAAKSQSASAPALGTAASFAVLGGSTVTNTGATVVTGDLGVAPGTAVTGFPPGLVQTGTVQAATAAALQAQADATTAYNSLAGQACDFQLTGQDLGGKTLTAGTYCFSSSAQLTGTLTLDAEGNPAAVFVFQIGSTLTTASSASVVLLNGASSCNVFWQVGSSATLGTATTLQGSVFALTGITLSTGANLHGRALARNGAVTLDTNDVNAVGCVGGAPGADAGAGGGGGSDAGQNVPDAGAGGGGGSDAGQNVPDAGAGGGAGGGGGSTGHGGFGGFGGGFGGGQGADAGDCEDAGAEQPFDAGVPAPFDAGQPEPDAGTTCPEHCIDTANDNNNCGAIGNVCTVAQQCVEGVCICSE